MAKIGAAALTFIGYAFGGPWGALIGGILGQILFPPPGIKGPRLSELNVQNSTIGAPIPIVYGTYALAGNIIWSGGLIETKHEDEQGGFLGMGGQKVTSYTYSVDLAIGLCEGPISGIRRIWADADSIYDASNDETLYERFLGGEIDTSTFLEETAQIILDFITGIRAASAQLDFELYLGTEDQLPDPTIQEYENVGYVGNVVPAYRGLAYIVFNDFQLAKFGNRIPNFRIEVVTNGTPAECGVYTAGHLEPWLEGVRDPRNPLNTHLYSGGGPFSTDIAAALADVGDGDFVLEEVIPGNTSPPTVHGWVTTVVAHCEDVATADRRDILLSVNRFPSNVAHFCDIPFFDDACNSFVASFGIGNLVWWSGGGVPGASRGYWIAVPDGESPLGAFEGHSPDFSCNAELFEDADVYQIVDQEVVVRRSLQPKCEFALDGGWCITGGVLTPSYIEVSGTFHVLREYRDTTAPIDPTVVLDYPLDPCIRNDSPFYNDEDFWTGAYNAAVAAGDIEAGLVYGVDYPDTQNYAYFAECDQIDVACVPMATIVADLCRRAGLRTDTGTQIDVSGLTTCVPGYAIGRQMSARDAMGPLRLFGLWDAVESGDILRFVERGAAIVDTIAEDDLGAHENGSEAPSSVEVTRIQEKELPRRLRLHFANFLFDHEPSEQSASRLTTEAVEELDVEVAVSMEPDTAAQLADIHLYDAWVSRSSYAFALDHDWLHLEPTDCIEIPVDGETVRVRLVAVNYKIGGILECEAIRDDDGSYQSTVVARPGTPSGGSPIAPGSGPICPSVAVLLDIPRLREADIDAGYYVAIYGLCPETWECAELYRSSDGGLTFGRIARTNDQVVVGEIVSITGPSTDPVLPGESPQYDTTNAITVDLHFGELSSITDAQIAAGQNMAAIGAHGRWVIIQFKTATFDTGDQWTLTDIIWGVNETQHLLYTTGNNDTFVLLSDPALIRVPEEAAAIGVSKEFKTVTCGQSIDAVTPFSFTTQGLSYRRTCPSTVISATLTAPPTGAADGDAYLLPNDTALEGEWSDHGGEIAHWSNETDSWVFCTPVPGTIVTIGVDSSSDPGDGSVISDGDGNYNPAPWTPAIPPLPDMDSGDMDTSYFVAYTGTGYVKVLGSEVGGGGGASPLTTKGDIYTYSTDDDRLPVGSNYDTVLANSATATGLQWGVPAIPSNAQTGNYTIAASDRGRAIDHTSGAGAGDTYTIDSNTNLALEVGFTFSVFNMATDDVTVAITADTLRKAVTGATGSVTIPQFCLATFRKVATTTWIWFGVGAV